METILIYPFNMDYASFVNNHCIMNNKKISSLVSPRGWGLEGEQIGDGDMSLLVGCDFNTEMNKCSVVWFVEDALLTLPVNLLKAKVNEVVQAGKKIIYIRYKNYDEYKQILPLIPEKNNISTEFVNILPEIQNIGSCYSIDTPVITVFGLEENTEKFNVQVALRKEFMDLGYRVSSVTSRRDSDILGMHSIPSYMFSNEKSVTEKIIHYNHYVKKIEIMEDPEIIIVGIPGGILPYDKKNHNNFGIFGYEISHAVPSDASIMCLPYNKNMNGDFEVLKNDIRGKFGFETDCYHIAAVAQDTRTILESGLREFVTLDKDFVRKKIEKMKDRKVFDLTEGNDLQLAAEIIIDKLSHDN